MNSECPYVADTDKGGHMSLPIQSNGPPHVPSMNVKREGFSVKHMHHLPLTILIGHIKSFWLQLTIFEVSFGYHANCWLEFLRCQVEDDLLYNVSFHVLSCCQFSTCCMSSVY